MRVLISKRLGKIITKVECGFDGRGAVQWAKRMQRVYNNIVSGDVAKQVV